MYQRRGSPHTTVTSTPAFAATSTSSIFDDSPAGAFDGGVSDGGAAETGAAETGVAACASTREPAPWSQAAPPRLVARSATHAARVRIAVRMGDPSYRQNAQRQSANA